AVRAVGGGRSCRGGGAGGAGHADFSFEGRGGGVGADGGVAAGGGVRDVSRGQDPSPDQHESCRVGTCGGAPGNGRGTGPTPPRAARGGAGVSRGWGSSSRTRRSRSGRASAW